MCTQCQTCFCASTRLFLRVNRSEFTIVNFDIGSELWEKTETETETGFVYIYIDHCSLVAVRTLHPNQKYPDYCEVVQRKTMLSSSRRTIYEYSVEIYVALMESFECKHFLANFTRTKRN